MVAEARKLVETQVGRARRRMFLQTLLGTCTAAWSIALILSVGWLLTEPYVLSSPPEWLRWVVAGIVVILGTVVAIGLAIRRSPTRTAAALAIDQHFGLRERVVTSVVLSEADAQ